MKSPAFNFNDRRIALAKRLPKGSIALIPAARERIRNGDAHFRFRQSSDFFYLTGLCEPQAILCLFADSPEAPVLFLRPNNPQEECWQGPRLGLDAVQDVLGIPTAYAYDALSHKLPELFLNIQSIYYPLGQDMGYEVLFREAWRKTRAKARGLQAAPRAWIDLAPHLAALRLYKDEDEIACIKEATGHSIDAHLAVMRRAREAKFEYELEAEFMYHLNQKGIRNLAYDSIVAGGPRACTLHYTANNQPLNSDELLLIDAGGEYNHYAADITRTYPLSGRFSSEQKALYELVLEAQQQAIAEAKPGRPWDAMQKAILATFESGLKALGIIQSVDEMSQFYMHNSGHWLGLDVHDAGPYRDENGSMIHLAPQMVLTVEPGLYIPQHCLQVDVQWRGIGIRIEDDILITNSGCEVLTDALPKSVDDLQAII